MDPELSTCGTGAQYCSNAVFGLRESILSLSNNFWSFAVLFFKYHAGHFVTFIVDRTFTNSATVPRITSAQYFRTKFSVPRPALDASVCRFQYLQNWPISEKLVSFRLLLTTHVSISTLHINVCTLHVSYLSSYWSKTINDFKILFIR